MLVLWRLQYRVKLAYESNGESGSVFMECLKLTLREVPLAQTHTSASHSVYEQCGNPLVAV
jgi:hypothetical protein